MRKYIFALAAVALICAPASAADMAHKAAPLPQASASWTGPYVGGNVGYGWSEEATKITGTDTNGAAIVGTGFIPPSMKTDARGWLGGVQAGYNWQAGMFVYGVEVDGMFSNIEGTANQNHALGPTVSLTTANKGNLDWLATFRARLGFNPWAATMFYVTGGGAVGNVKSTITSTLVTPFPPLNGTATGAIDETKWGWTAGVGVEHFFTPSLSLKTEALYVDLGSSDYRYGTTVAGAPVNFAGHIDNKYYLARAGLNYHW